MIQFEQLYNQYFLHLCNFSDQYVYDSEISKDIVQKIFIGLWERRSEINPDQSIKSYLFTAVKNRCLNYIRDHKKYRSRVLDLECGDFDLWQDSDHSVSELDDLKMQIDQALQDLPEKCRLVFQMSRFEEMKYKDIALKLEISEKTVEAHMTKALKSLRNSLQKYLIYILVTITLMN